MTVLLSADSKSPSEQHQSMEGCQFSSATSSTSYPEPHSRLQSEPEALATVTVAVAGPIDPYRFNMFMSDLLAERGSDIKQMYGTLSIQGYGKHGTHFKFEGAQNTVRFGPAVRTAAENAHTCASQVTFCGRHLSAQDLQEALDSCAWLPVAPGWTEHYAPGIQQPFYVHQATGRKQWLRPAAVEAQPASPFRSHLQASSVTLASQSATPQLARPPSYASELSDNSLEATSMRMQQRLHRSEARSAVSCPCNASDACAAVFDIRCREKVYHAKRTRDEDVTSKLADLDFSEGCMALFDSASELEAARTGQGKVHKRKMTSTEQFKQDMREAKEGLRRSNSCQWMPRQLQHGSQTAAFGC